MFSVKKPIYDNVWIDFVICLLSSLAFILLFSLIASLITGLSSDPTGMIHIGSFITLIVSAIVSGIFSSSLGKKRGWLFAPLVCLGAILIAMLASLIVKGGISTSALMNYLSYAGIYVLSSLWIRRRRSGRGHRRKLR